MLFNQLNAKIAENEVVNVKRIQHKRLMIKTREESVSQFSQGTFIKILKDGQ